MHLFVPLMKTMISKVSFLPVNIYTPVFSPPRSHFFTLIYIPPLSFFLKTLAFTTLLFLPVSLGFHNTAISYRKSQLSQHRYLFP